MRTQFIYVVFITFLLCPLASAQWVHVNTGLTDTNVVVLVALGQGEIFAGTAMATQSAPGGTVFRSTNNGMSWVQCAPAWHDSAVVGVAAIPHGAIIAGLASHVYRKGGAIMRSTDGGLQWNVVQGFGVDTSVSSVVRGGGGILFAGTRGWSGSAGTVFRSVDSGATWTAVKTGLASYPVTSLAIRGTDVFAGSYGGVLLSTDNGTSWTSTPTGLTSQYVYTLAVGGTNLFAGTVQGGVFLSTNSGGSWTEVNNGLTDKQIYGLATSGTTLFAGTDTAGVFRSTNAGTSWDKVNTGLTSLSVKALAVGEGYLFAAIDRQGVWRRPLSEMVTWVDPGTAALPNHFVLHQNYPNPFNPTTTIKYELPKSSMVRLSVYDLVGRKVSELVNERRDAGVHKVKFDGSNLASGLYFYRLQAGDFVSSKKLLLLK